MASRIAQLVLTVVMTVVYFGVLMDRAALDWRDFATMLVLGFCFGIDVCRLLYWGRVGRHHAR